MTARRSPLLKVLNDRDLPDWQAACRDGVANLHLNLAGGHSMLRTLRRLLSPWSANRLPSLQSVKAPLSAKLIAVAVAQTTSDARAGRAR
jgi:hypothetical protein